MHGPRLVEYGVVRGYQTGVEVGDSHDRIRRIAEIAARIIISALYVN
jgi:hypothetical protein